MGYDRLGHLYIHKESCPAFRPSIFHFRAVSPRLLDDFWGFSPPDSALICLSLMQFLARLITPSLLF